MKYLGKAEEVLLTFDSESINSIVTDPPYGVNFKSHYDDSKEYVFGIIDTWFSEMYRVLKNDSYAFIFVPTLEIHKWIIASEKAGFKLKNIITTKAYFIGGRGNRIKNFDSSAQHILFLSKGKGKKLNKYDLIPTSKDWFKDKRNPNPKEFTYLYPNFINSNIIFANTKSTKNNSKETNRHPNEKNVELLKFFVGISTNGGDVVLDPFAGSGSTSKACKELKRNCISIEKDEYWFNKIEEVILKT